MLTPPGKQHKHFFLAIRYSIVSEELKGAWRLSKERSVEEIRKDLYAPDRLTAREYLFRHITFSSIINQSIALSADWLTVIIMIGEHLPEPWKGNLYAMTKEYPWIKIIKVKEQGDTVSSVFSSVISAQGGSMIYGTSRIDDDDALDKDFMKDTMEYCRPAYKGMALSYGNGYALVIKHRKVLSAHHYYHPKLAIGMSYFNEFSDGAHHGRFNNIFDLGNHTLIDKKAPTLLISNKKSFIRSYHAATDSMQVHTREARKLPEVNSETHLKDFNITVPFITSRERKFHHSYPLAAFNLEEQSSVAENTYSINLENWDQINKSDDCVLRQADSWQPIDYALTTMKGHELDTDLFAEAENYIQAWTYKRFNKIIHQNKILKKISAFVIQQTSNKKTYNMWVYAENRVLKIVYLQWLLKYYNTDIDFYANHRHLIEKHREKLTSSTKNIDTFGKIHNLNASKALLWAFDTIDEDGSYDAVLIKKMKEIVVIHASTENKKSKQYVTQKDQLKKTLYSPWWNEQDYTDFMPE